MAAAWIALAGLASVDTVWLSLSRLSFAANNWDSIIRLVLFKKSVIGNRVEKMLAINEAA